jgi:hypothetical protein
MEFTEILGVGNWKREAMYGQVWKGGICKSTALYGDFAPEKKEN